MFEKPQEVSQALLVFPGSVSHLMPAYSEIPDEFKNGHTKWNELQSTWFFKGLSGVDIKPKDGIDLKTAVRHLACIQGSYEPKHEHKGAAVAYLSSLWFDDVAFGVVSA